MMASNRMLKLAKTGSAVVCLWFLIVVPLWYLGHYLLEPQNPYRGEYLQGAGISVMILAPVAVVVFLGVRYVLRKRRL